jgi:hypoxanthine-guanine phosphoribosyltransferase
VSTGKMDPVLFEMLSKRETQRVLTVIIIEKKQNRRVHIVAIYILCALLEKSFPNPTYEAKSVRLGKTIH